MSLVAYNKETGEPVPIGSEVVDFRGDKAILVGIERVNEMRYGGYRSGKVAVECDSYTYSYYDGVFGLEVRETDREPKNCPLCGCSPVGWVGSSGIYYRCPDCNYSGAPSDSWSGARENWNAGITQEYEAEIEEAEE
ncbi:MAG: hypothetical protein AB7S83_05850 [Candidatus Methanomethylophilaceae archaeon]